MNSLFRVVAALVASCVLVGCGSGVAALLVGSRGGSSGAGSETPPPPTLIATSGTLAPLSAAAAPLMRVRLQDVPDPPPGAEIVVEIRWLDGAVIDTPLSIYRSATDSVEFLFDIPNIRQELVARLGSAAYVSDVAAELAVLIDGEHVAPALPFTLLKRPVAVPESTAPIIVVSAEGTDVVTVKLQSAVLQLPVGGDPGSADYTRELIELNDLRATVAFGDLPDLTPEQSAPIQSVMPTPVVGEYDIEFVMPRTNNPTQAQLTIDSFPSGRSSLISRIFCRPVLFGTSPATGSTDGGSAVVLFGQALIPTNKASGELEFEKIQLKVRKGGRVAEIPVEMIRRNLSKQNQLVFSMPASPDGTPGPARLELTVVVGANPPPRQTSIEELTASKSDAFYYGDTYPNFGPRGARLPDLPVAVRAGPFVSRGLPTADLLSLSQGPLGVPYVGLFSNRGNGMFVRFGQRVRAGNPEDLAQRNPADLCIGQFSSSGPPSGVILNQANGLIARHSLVLGNNLTNPPLRFFESLPVKESGRRCKGGFLNGDGVEDLVVLGKHVFDETPALYLSDTQSSAGGFIRDLLPYSGVPYRFTGLEIADLDKDGYQDLVFAQAGLTPRVLIAFGDPTGKFLRSNFVEPLFDLGALGYALHQDSTIVDVQAISSEQDPVLAFVISGALGQVGSPPAVVSLKRSAQPRGFEPLQSSDLLTFPGATRVFSLATSGDLTGDGLRELVVAASGDTLEPLRVFRYDNATLRVAVDAVDLGVEEVSNIKSIEYGLATVETAHHQNTDRVAVFVAHEARVAGGTEHRVSTFFSVPGPLPSLLPATPARQIEETVLGISVGRFRTRSAIEAAGESSDAWVAIAGGLKLLQNDGLGEISLSSQSILDPQIVPSSLTRVSAGHSTGNLEAPCVLTSDGRIGMVLPVDLTRLVWAGGGSPLDLREAAPPFLRQRNVQGGSLIKCQDLDGDSILDLVVLLNLSLGASQGLEGEALFLFLRGLPDPAQGVFPYELVLPTSGEANGVTHGNASAMVLGDFAIQTSSPNPLELAVIIPVGSPGSTADGNHVRAYRYDVGDHQILRSSTDPTNKVWVVGAEPNRALAGDYNGDGRTDLAIASRGDSMLRVLYNFSPRGGSPGLDVDLGAFQEAPANPIPFSGVPDALLGGDLNGDTVPDVVLVTASVNGSSRDQDVVFFLSPGKLGGVSSGGVVPPERTGNLMKSGTSWVLRNGTASVGLGDLNGDNAPDLVIGWASISKDDYNLRVLFGNSF